MRVWARMDDPCVASCIDLGDCMKFERSGKNGLPPGPRFGERIDYFDLFEILFWPRLLLLGLRSYDFSNEKGLDGSG